MKRINKQELPEHIQNPKRVELVKVPEDWIFINAFFKLNMSDVVEYIKQGHDDLRLFFVSDTVYIATPDEEKVISVDWLPDADTEGCFVCYVVHQPVTVQPWTKAAADVWDNPIEKKKFKTWQEVRDWVNEWIEKLKEEEKRELKSQNKD